MISKLDLAVGRGGLWSNNENSLVIITLPYYRRPTFGPTIFDRKPTVDLGACPFQMSLSLSKALSLSFFRSLSFRLLYKTVPITLESLSFKSLSLLRKTWGIHGFSRGICRH